MVVVGQLLLSGVQLASWLHLVEQTQLCVMVVWEPCEGGLGDRAMPALPAQPAWNVQWSHGSACRCACS